MLRGIVEDEDVKGIEESLSDVANYIRFKDMVELGIMMKPKDIKHYDYLVFTTVKNKLREMQNERR